MSEINCNHPYYKPRDCLKYQCSYNIRTRWVNKNNFNRVRFQLCLSRRGKICIFKYGECKPSFSQRVKFCRKTVDEEGLYPVMGVSLRGVFYNYFREGEPFTLQRIAARRIIDCFVNENGQMEVHGHIPRPVENLLRKAFKKTGYFMTSCKKVGR